MASEMHDSTLQLRQFLSARQRAREAFVTTLLWALYGYLWLPLVSLAAWYFGVDFAYERVIKAGGPDELILLLISFSIIVLIVLLIVVSWSGFQYSRFSGSKERRNRAPVMDLDAERELWELDESTYERVKNRNVMTVVLSDDAKITEIRSVQPVG